MTSPPAPRSDKLCHPCVRPTTRRSSQPGCLQLVGDVLVREEDHRLAAPNLEKRGGAADASVSVSPLAGGETEESEGGQSRRGESRGLPLTLQLLGTTPCMSIIAPSSRSSALRTDSGSVSDDSRSLRAKRPTKAPDCGPQQTRGGPATLYRRQASEEG